ncbi:hypothetical protein Pmani_008879 [Petrolisthes manimaculis]|uniref:Uncharacterized protein n=1 Tax=Petrolisthes manimaculis TaxID=1843537 RepID=A0AAE1Q5F5_9EUCA|nr:hypothetical protein Pmani_008879 [Petrolisthes manimaculis]
MLGIVYVVGVWCLVGAFADPGHRAMGRLYWCENPLCICSTQTNEQVQCYDRQQLYTLIGLPQRKRKTLVRINWKLEEKLIWCSDVCLCHKDTNKEFDCMDEQSLVSFINNTIGDSYFYNMDTEVEEGVEPEPEPETEEMVVMQPVVTEETVMVLPDVTEEDSEESEHRKRSERRKNRRQRKQKRRREEEAATTEHDAEALPEPEPEPESEPEPIPPQEPEPTPLHEPEPTAYQEPTQPAYTRSSTTPSPPLLNRGQTEAPWSGEQDMGEPLPKQEAVAASPAITAMQPPTRRQPFPSTVQPYTPRVSLREVDIINPKAEPVLEVPIEKKTMATKVSQDLDGLATTVLEIQSHVVLNQRILFVTMALAAIAMLG